jgi:hypothetical protein
MASNGSVTVPSSEAQRPSKRNSEPVRVFAGQVSWVRTIVAAGIALLVAGAAAALWSAQFATSEKVAQTMERHETSDSPHPVIRRDLQGIEQRLIRIETVQTGLSDGQRKIEDKLDRVIERVQFLRTSPSGYAALPSPPVP